MAAPAPRERPAAVRLGDFVKGRGGKGYLVKGLLTRGSYAEVYGAPGAGKTFVVLDLAYHIAAGKEWHGCKVHGGPVLYLPYEGMGGLVNRAKALRQHYGDKDVPLFIAGGRFNLREKEGRAGLGELIRTLPEKPALVVIDTLAHALMGGDENSAQDVSAFNSGVQALIDHTGATVLIVHHSGKDKTKGARGSSALNAAIDTEIEIDEGRLQPTKQRDIELHEPIGFQLKPLVVDIDEDGDEITSCVVVPSQVVSGAELPALRGNPLRGMGVLAELSPDNKPVAIADWQAACREFLGDKGRQRFFDMKKTLVDKGVVMVQNGMVTRRLA